MNLKARVFLCAVSLILARVANIMVPQYYKGAIDELSGKGGEEIRFPMHFIMMYTIMKILQSVSRDIRQFVWIDVEQDTSKRIKLRVFSHLHSLSLAFHLDRKTGEILKVVERGASSLQSLLTMALFTIVPTIIDLLLVCAVLLYASEALLSGIVLATMLIYGYVTVALTNWRKKFRRDAIAADNQANDRAVNSLLNFETVKFFGMEERERKALDDSLTEYNKANWRNEVSLNSLNVAQQLILAIGAFLCMYISALRVVEGRLTVGDFVMVQAYLAQISSPLVWLGTAWRIIQQGFIDTEKMFDILQQLPDIMDAPGAPDLVVKEGRIDLEEVYFKYGKGGPILRGVSLAVPPRSSLAIVGPTGAGKSTIARLLFRLYDLDPDAGGAIRIDGADIRHVTQASLRRAIGVVPQDTVLFNDTVKYNLLYGRPDASDEEVEQAARAAAIHEAIMGFPDQYKTKVGERGLRLSGGEKQRVAIARTILKDPRIVLLDEATSALDTHTEHMIQDSLDRMCKGRTTVVIAHRLSTIIHSDVIAVLSAGVVAEQGSHVELVGRPDGLYAAMWRRQLEQRAPAEPPLPMPADLTASPGPTQAQVSATKFAVY